MKDVASSWLHGTPWRLISLILVAWCAASFAFAMFLGRLIRRADERAGVVPIEPELQSGVPGGFRAQSSRGVEREPRDSSGVRSKMDGTDADRRIPSRSGPFMIERQPSGKYVEEARQQRRRRMH
jgi:hypothetical protein